MAALPEHDHVPTPRLDARVIGYLTTAPELDRAELRARERAVARACKRRGWQLTAIVCERADGRLLQRPGMTYALERIADGHASELVVSDGRLLSRSPDFAALVQRLADAEATLIALDLGVDTSTPEGSRLTRLLITLNGWRHGHDARPRSRREPEVTRSLLLRPPRSRR
jgi:DNA invertase Pin-like site-specific DNA recombinase